MSYLFANVGYTYLYSNLKRYKFILKHHLIKLIDIGNIKKIKYDLTLACQLIKIRERYIN